MRRRRSSTALALILLAPGPLWAQVPTSTRSSSLVGAEDLPRLDAALVTVRASFEAALTRWNELANTDPNGEAYRDAGDALRREERRLLGLQRALELAKDAPMRAVAKLRVEYDTQVAEIARVRTSLLPGGRLEAELQRQVNQLDKLAEAPPTTQSASTKLLTERLSDVERLDEALRTAELDLAFAERLHERLGRTIFDTYALIEREVASALAAYAKLEETWPYIQGDEKARRYLGPVVPPAAVVSTLIVGSVEDPGLLPLWQRFGGQETATAAPSVRRFEGDLVSYRTQVEERRLLRDRLVYDTERLRTLEAERLARPNAEEATALVAAASTSEYVQLGQRIRSVEARLEAISQALGTLSEERAVVEEALSKKRNELRKTEASLGKRTDQWQAHRQKLTLDFPRNPRRELSRPEVLTNFVLGERLSSERTGSDFLERAVRRVEIRLDVLLRRDRSLQEEAQQLRDTELPRLRRAYYETIAQTFAIRGIRVVIVLILAMGVLRLIRRGGETFLSRIVDQTLKRQGVAAIRQQRTRTVMSVFLGGARFIVYVLATLFVIGQLDIDTGPLLVAAGGLSLAVGFGAQALVRDFFAGFFILLEGQYSIGDVVDIEGKSGTVEDLNLRTTVLRSLNGEVHTIPNGEIKTTTNKTKHWSRAIVEVGVAYEEDIEQVMAVLRQVAAEMGAEEAWQSDLRSSEVPGVERLDDSAVIIRVILETSPGKQWQAAREYQLHVKKTFDQLGIEIPWPQHVVTNKKTETDPQSVQAKKRAIRGFVGVSEPEGAPQPSLEDRDRAEVLANKEAALQAAQDRSEQALEAPTLLDDRNPLDRVLDGAETGDGAEPQDTDAPSKKGPGPL